MKTKLIIAAVACILAMPVFADFELIEQGYEVSLADIRLPRNEDGTISFKPCDDCDYELRRVDTDVRWEIDGEAMTLSQFRLRIASISKHNTRPVTVSRHIKSDRIVRISLTIPNSE